MSTYQEILDFWFSIFNEERFSGPQSVDLWFDEAHESTHVPWHFADYLKNAINGKYDAWQHQADSCLALIILLLPVSRRLQLDTAINKTDLHALHACQQGILYGLDRKLSLIERLFFYMPMMLSEDILVQEHSISYYKELVEISLPESSTFYKCILLMAIQNYEIIRMFGRFPERNAELQREPTADETAFLREVQRAESRELTTTS